VPAADVVVERRGRTWRHRAEPADEPVLAEQREAAHDAQPHTVTVGPKTPE
jgi:hypothetical protein